MTVEHVVAVVFLMPDACLSSAQVKLCYICSLNKLEVHLSRSYQLSSE